MAIELLPKRIHPFLRWAGGKSWLIDSIGELLQDNTFVDYYEPFLGGGSVFFSLNTNNGNAYLSDTNKDLIDTYKAIQKNPQRVIDYLKTFDNTEEFYYQKRAELPQGLYQRAARFIYLNHASYNGLYRVNRKGVYNVPYGKRKNLKIDEVSIFEASRALQNATLSSGDFANNLDTIHENSLVFIDPPYTVSTKNNGFIEYNQEIFSIEDQQRLSEYADAIKNRGAYYILTNTFHPTIKEIFSNCDRVFEVERQSLIGGANARRGLVKEYVFTNILRGV